MDLAPDGNILRPLPYHADVVAFLKKHEQEVWTWASTQQSRAEHIEEVRANLLRDTYRLDAGAHPQVHAALASAMQRLGIDAPVTLYQSGGQQMNASLIFVPGEIHVLLQGPVLERLDDNELLALFGHELSHYLLWSLDNGDYLIADRILNDALASSNSASSHHETARRYSLHTELFADRGGAVAAQAVAPAVSALVKVHTGIANVDASSYLRQAGEIDARETGTTGGTTHPETFVRARALDLWWQRSDELDAWIEAKLHGPLALRRLDLPGQHQLQTLTRGFLAWFLAEEELRSEAVLNQVRQLFPDWTPQEPAAAAGAFLANTVDDSVLGYLNTLMMDLALADDDVRDDALLRAARIAQEIGSMDALQVNLKRDARFGKRELDRLNRKLAKEIQA
jgi:hypothetical protein